MENDPILSEIHRVREEIAAKFNYDMQAIVQYMQHRQRESGAAVVRRPPRPVDPIMVGPVRKPDGKTGQSRTA
jgi:hypothetical protein